MLYQFPFEPALYITLFDLAIISLVILVPRLNKRKFRIAAYTLLIVIFGTTSIPKLWSTSSAPWAIAPEDIVLKSDDYITNVYHARSTDEGYFIFWKDHFYGKEGQLTIDLEGGSPDELILIRKVNGTFMELQPLLFLTGHLIEPLEIDVSDSQFQPLSKESELAVQNVWKRDLVNYFSNLVSILFLIVFIWRINIKVSSPVDHSEP